MSVSLDALFGEQSEQVMAENPPVHDKNTPSYTDGDLSQIPRSNLFYEYISNTGSSLHADLILFCKQKGITINELVKQTNQLHTEAITLGCTSVSNLDAKQIGKYPDISPDIILKFLKKTAHVEVILDSYHSLLAVQFIPNMTVNVTEKTVVASNGSTSATFQIVSMNDVSTKDHTNLINLFYSHQLFGSCSVNVEDSQLFTHLAPALCEIFEFSPATNTKPANFQLRSQSKMKMLSTEFKNFLPLFNNLIPSYLLVNDALNFLGRSTLVMANFLYNNKDSFSQLFKMLETILTNHLKLFESYLVQYAAPSRESLQNIITVANNFCNSMKTDAHAQISMANLKPSEVLKNHRMYVRQGDNATHELCEIDDYRVGFPGIHPVVAREAFFESIYEHNKIKDRNKVAIITHDKEGLSNFGTCFFENTKIVERKVDMLNLPKILSGFQYIFDNSLLDLNKSGNAAKKLRQLNSLGVMYTAKLMLTSDYGVYTDLNQFNEVFVELAKNSQVFFHLGPQFHSNEFFVTVVPATTTRVDPAHLMGAWKSFYLRVVQDVITTSHYKNVQRYCPVFSMPSIVRPIFKLMIPLSISKQSKQVSVDSDVTFDVLF